MSNEAPSQNNSSNTAQSAAAPRSNVPEFSVTDLASSLKRTLEDNFGRVRVRGELSRVSIAGSGHMYSSLKDDGALIDAVCWKGNLNKLSIRPEEGLEVICTGKISSYPKSSKYQLVIESMELAGEGALLKMLEERKQKLTAEGLFAPERKQNLPFLPRTIGVVTSPTGAVIRDILHRLADRMPSHVLVWPVLVQGDGAANQVVNAINGFNALTGDNLPRPDLLIVARGGGSLEDLMAFNEENVVRAAADSKIPIISAVGHETDTTLIDYAADLRAPTPTGAAEMAVPVRANLMAQILDDEGRMVSAISRQITENRHKLEAHTARLGDPAKLLEIKTQSLDHIGEKISTIYGGYLSQKREMLLRQSGQLQTPKARLQEATNALGRWNEQLKSSGETLTKNADNKLESLGRTLEAYSFKKTLERGFSLIRTTKGTPVTNAKTARKHEILSVEFKDNEHVNVSLNDTPLQKSKPKPKKQEKPKDTDQQTLF